MVLSKHEFEQKRTTPKSRWAGLVDQLLNTSEPIQVPLKPNENTPIGRSTIQRSVRCIARFRGMKVRILTVTTPTGAREMFVRRSGWVKSKAKAAKA